MAASNFADYGFRHFRSGDEHGIVDVLRRCFDSWQNRGLSYWRWSTVESPDFSTEDVLTIHHRGRLIGCFHSAVHPLRLEPGVEVLASFDGNFAIVPEHRGKGLPIPIHDRGDAELLARGVALRGGFSKRILHTRFYRPRYGYRYVPTDTIVYRKVLGTQALRDHAERLSKRLFGGRRIRVAAASRPFIVDLCIDGLPPGHVTMTESGLIVEEGPAADADIRIKAPYAVLAPGTHHPALRAWRLATALLRGRLRTQGAFRNAPVMIRLGGAIASDTLARRRDPANSSSPQGRR